MGSHRIIYDTDTENVAHQAGHRGWSKMRKYKSKMADVRHFENTETYVSQSFLDRFASDIVCRFCATLADRQIHTIQGYGCQNPTFGKSSRWQRP